MGWTWQDLQTYAAQFPSALITVEKYSEAKRISLQQIRWWKGVLLPALSKSTGDSIAYWEVYLKLNVMSDEFKPFVVIIGGVAMNAVPSILNLSCEKACILVEGSVDHLRNKCGMDWVELPDAMKRKT